MIEKLYKWLPIVFGCHCRDDRSFYYHGRKFPICARCTGILLGFIVSFLVNLIAGIILKIQLESGIIDFLFLIPLIADGIIQYRTNYISNNRKRFVTGVLFGYGFISLFIKSAVFTLYLGYNFRK